MTTMEILQDVELRQQHETASARTHAQDKEEFARLLRRYAELGRSFTAQHQQDRASMNQTLMKLYVKLNPRSSHYWYDDFDVVMRDQRRVSAGAGAAAEGATGR